MVENQLLTQLEFYNLASSFYLYFRFKLKAVAKCIAEHCFPHVFYINTPSSLVPPPPPSPGAQWSAKLVGYPTVLLLLFPPLGHVLTRRNYTPTPPLPLPSHPLFLLLPPPSFSSPS